jgi:hypothetical protein
METMLQINDSTPAPRPKFLARQFASVTTRSQLKFDWTFGVLRPIVCIAADPVVFSDSMSIYSSQGLLFKFKILCYSLSATSILSMAAWLLWGGRLGELRPFLGGLFLVAAAVSMSVGIYLIPFSLLGILFVGVGLLGFTPLLSGFVFLRNSFRALESSAEDMPPRYVVRAAMLAVIYALVVPYVLNF